MKQVLSLSFASIILCMTATGQEIDRYRFINVTFNTSSPAQLTTNRGRLIWRDEDVTPGMYFLKYFSGSEITILDSNLSGVTATIEGDHVAWNTAAEQVNLFNIRTWNTSLVGGSYNPDASQPLAVSNGLLAYARRKSGTGTEIVLRRIAAATDTVFDAALWNTQPSLHHGQVAWVGSATEAITSPSDIFYFDGLGTRNISNTTGMRNRQPLVRDGQAIWLQTTDSTSAVKLFTGDSLFTIAQTASPTTFVAGFDLSDGIAVAALVDTASGASAIRFFNAESLQFTVLTDTLPVSSLHIDNGHAIWASGVKPDKFLRRYDVETGMLEDWGATDDPVLDDRIVAWTFGDAVEMSVPITEQRLTTDGLNGWEQTRFKNNYQGKILWGNYLNSQHMRLFYWDGAATRQLTDSSIYRDLAMLNDGVGIWREDFNTLWMYDGAGQPVMIVDSLQCENMYVANGSIGFFGFRLGNSINQAWIYLLGTDSLIQLTNDTSDTIANRNVLTDGNTACWERQVDQENMMMYYDGNSTVRISDFAVSSLYSYRKGRIVWSEERSGIYQIMMYDTALHTRSQLSNSTNDINVFVSDGDHVVWLEAGTTPAQQIMWYFDVATGTASKVAHASTGFFFRWMWMSNGKFAWRQRNETYVFDGNSVLQLTEDGATDQTDIALTAADVDNEYVLWIRNGDVYKSKLQPRPGFDAVNIAGYAPLPVSFFNRSWNGTRSFLWNFGDGNTSSESNPVHVYQNPGTYTVTLTVTGPGGSTAERKIHLVRVQSSTSVLKKEELPTTFALDQNFPNPFNPATTIRYDLPHQTHVVLRVYDMLGRLVETIVDKSQEAGRKSVPFDAKGLSSGVYFYRISAGTYHSTKKLMILR